MDIRRRAVSGGEVVGKAEGNVPEDPANEKPAEGERALRAAPIQYCSSDW